MSLDEYKKKRDFGKTPEPAGSESISGEARFVVQKHQARQLHYDFRLEMEGVLKSWAVPKGLPLDTGIRRLAVQVEDHPVSYIDFSGTIPNGEYGAGTVDIWDSGNYTIENITDETIEIVLSGNILSGRYVLVHTDGKNWLVMKRRDIS